MSLSSIDYRRAQLHDYSDILRCVAFQFLNYKHFSTYRPRFITIGVISQERLKIEVKLLLSANRKSYMPRRLAQQQMTLSDLE